VFAGQIAQHVNNPKETIPMATKDFKAGDKVSWNSSQGKVTGIVKKKLIAPTDIKTHHVAASPEHPQLLVESVTSGQPAAHKPEALKQVKAK
jgi:hypothetical protein